MKVGLLTSRHEPLLPIWVGELLSAGLDDLYVIYDKKKPLQRDVELWQQRTGGEIDKLAGSIKKYDTNLIKDFPTYEFDSHNDSLCSETIKSLRLVYLLNAGTPRKLNAQVIDSVPGGVVNIHPGYLPFFRGSCAVEWSLWTKSPVANTAHFMDVNYDSGDLLEVEIYEVERGLNYQQIRTMVYLKGCKLAAKILKELRESEGVLPKRKPQNENKAKFWEPMPTEILDRLILKLRSF